MCWEIRWGGGGCEGAGVFGTSAGTLCETAVWVYGCVYSYVLVYDARYWVVYLYKLETENNALIVNYWQEMYYSDRKL